ncbi:phosphatidylinositol transfer protein csr1 [Dispira parvispora]|uniref:Phosphatidylinositol transfer protein csr1 n=1 Tax=Dispira parvispora TaxID=1520584 RepID=A0A9W8DZ72_9FUNG|nr:phosphatidylinositol transfer protein csr1 [Dispira parvispora]
MVSFKPRFGYTVRSKASVSLNTSNSTAPRPLQSNSPYSSPSSTPPSTPPPSVLDPTLYAFRLFCRTEIPRVLEAIEGWFDYHQVDRFLEPFLRFHKGKMQAAAHQLYSYWTFRTERLGINHHTMALLPYGTFSRSMAASLGTMSGNSSPFSSMLIDTYADHASESDSTSTGSIHTPFIDVPGTVDSEERAIIIMTMSRLVPLAASDKSGLLMAQKVWLNLERLLLTPDYTVGTGPSSPGVGFDDRRPTRPSRSSALAMSPADTATEKELSLSSSSAELKSGNQLQTKGMCILLDMRGMGMLNGEKATLEFLIDAIQNRFPIKLGALFVIHPPTWFSLVWTVVRRTMKPKLLQRVRVVTSVDQLYGFIDKDRLPLSLGGLVKTTVS